MDMKKVFKYHRNCVDYLNAWFAEPAAFSGTEISRHIDQIFDVSKRWSCRTSFYRSREILDTVIHHYRYDGLLHKYIPVLGFYFSDLLRPFEYIDLKRRSNWPPLDRHTSPVLHLIPRENNTYDQWLGGDTDPGRTYYFPIQPGELEVFFDDCIIYYACFTERYFENCYRACVFVMYLGKNYRQRYQEMTLPQLENIENESDLDEWINSRVFENQKNYAFSNYKILPVSNSKVVFMHAVIDLFKQLDNSALHNKFNKTHFAALYLYLKPNSELVIGLNNDFALELTGEYRICLQAKDGWYAAGMVERYLEDLTLDDSFGLNSNEYIVHYVCVKVAPKQYHRLIRVLLKM